MILKKALVAALFILLSVEGMSQASLGKYKLPAIVVEGDTIPVVTLPGVQVIDFADPEMLKNLQAYYRLRYNVIKVYPYARLAALKIHELNATLDTLQTKREKKKFTKAFEKQLKADFEDQLKKLSINQGKVLVKLIDRETGSTSYEAIKELRGSLNAFFWQKMAWFYGNNLKTEYNPTEGEDKTIESIVQMIESGQINQN